MSSVGSPWFWSVLASAGRNLNTLAQQLEKMSREELLEYAAEYQDAMEEVNPYCFDEVSWDRVSEAVAAASLSEDGAEDYAMWVVSLGDAFFDEVCRTEHRIAMFFELFEESERRDGPNRWDLSVDRPEYRGSQSPFDIAAAVYAVRFGSDFLDDLDRLRDQRDAQRGSLR
jgi:hypothetical protein